MRKLLTAKKIWPLILAFFIQTAVSGQAISGNTCVVQGSTETYSYSGPYDGFTYFEWCVTGGVFTGTPYTCVAGGGMVTVQITWASNTTSGSVVCYPSNAGSASINVTGVIAVTGGTITAATKTQTLRNNLVPATINCTPSTGGGCFTIYSYQWQQSTDMSGWTNVSGATGQNLGFSAPLAQTTYFRRRVSESYGGVAYSDVAYKYITTPIGIGGPTCVTAGIPIQYYATGSWTTDMNMQWCVSGGYIQSTGSSCQSGTPLPAVQVVWYNNTAGSIWLTTPEEDPGLNVSIAIPVIPGSLTSGITQNIPYLSKPANIVCSNASGGACSPAYVYQWQQSGNNSTWTDVPASVGTVTGKDLVFANNFQAEFNMYYRRRVTETVSGNVAYSNAAHITIFYPPAIAGPTSCIIPGIPYTYSITGTIGNVTNFNWCAEGGIIVGGGSCLSGAAVTSVQVTWSAGTSNLTCALTSINSSDLVIANVTTLVNNHFVILPASQEVSYGAAFTLYPQQTIGAPCVGVNTFQWQKSTDNTNWTNVSGATGETYINAENIAQKTWYRRISTGASGTSHTSNSVYVTLLPFAAGAISASNLLLNYNAAPAITQTPATGGLCLSSAYVYEWQQSIDGGAWQSVGSTAAYPAGAPALIGPTRIRRKVTCGNAVLYTNELSFNINYISANAENLNYVRTNNVLRKGVISWIQSDQLPAGQKLQTTMYYDGLGRAAEKVEKQLSPLQYDMVTPMEYDKMGREAKKYLSYRAATQTGKFVSTAITDQNNYLVAGATPFYAGESHAYTQQTYEPSPIGRVTKTMAPGINWTGANRGVGIQYLFNAVGDSVRIWTIAATPGALPVSTMRYDAGRLFKNITTDEQNRQVVEYKNKEDKVVLRKVQLAASPGTAHVGWLCTYYVYDDLHNLRFVLQPKAVQLIISNFTVTPAIASELCFRYEYDKRNRQVVRKVPGSGELWQVYDARDRLVMSQDSLLRQQGKWLVTEYDSRNRNIRTGLLTNAAHRSVHHDSAYTRIGYPATGGSNYELLTQTYYDNYAWVAGTGTTLSATLDATNTANSAYFITTYNTAPAYAQPVTPSYQTTGLTTGTKTKILGSNPAKYLYTVTFYDDRSRTIQTQRINITGGKDIQTTQYSFSGKELRRFDQHQKAAPNAQTHNLLTKLTYDHANRLLTASKTITSTINSKTVSKPEQTIISHQYDELGNLKTKTLGGGIENLVNDYTIRGWLLGVNRQFVNDAATNYFGFELGYDKAPAIIAGTNYATPQFNGNISGTIWKSAGDPEKRKYDFTYDNANRFAAADFNQRFGATWAKADPGNAANNIDFSVSGLSYDANGNILSLHQKGWKAGGSGLIDQLTYTYNNSNASNRLLAVTESTAIGTSDYKLGDFTDKNRTADDYQYNGNGNLVVDRNKNISGITYNHLNMPQQVNVQKADATAKGTVTYIYDASGTTLGKTIVDNLNGVTTAYQYIDGFEYRNDTLLQAAHEKGRIRYAKKYLLNGDSAWQYFYDYFLEDHLGNVRMVLTEQKDTAQYMATHEAAYRAKENKLFYNIVPAYAKALVPGGYPADATTNPNDSLARLNGSAKKVGPAILLRVMSGDKIDVAVKSFYRPQGSAGTNVNAITDILSALASGIVSVAGDSKGTLAQLNNPSTSPLLGALNSFRTTNNTVPTGKPKAYLNWVLLDERFNYVASYPQSGAVVVGNADALNTLAYTGIPITKNGFLYIYVSNETQNWDVFFDNLSIRHYTGPVQEETHYYPFGLTMAGISSKAMARQECTTKFQGQQLAHKEFSDDSGLEMYAFKYRMHDPQTGRFWQADPLSNQYVHNSTYAFSENKVTAHVELEGLETTDYFVNEIKSEIAADFQAAANAIDNTLSFFHKLIISSEMSSTPVSSSSVSTTINRSSSTNVGGMLSYIIRHNSNEGSSEPYFKTTTTYTSSAKNEIKTPVGSVSTKVSKNDQGVVTLEGGASGTVVIEGVPVKLEGSGGRSSDGGQTASLQASTGINNAKALVNVQYTSGGKKQGVAVGAGTQNTLGKTTYTNIWGFKISWPWEK